MLNSPKMSPYAGYTCNPPPGIGIRGNLLGCKPNQEVSGEVESVIRVSRSVPTVNASIGSATS